MARPGRRNAARARSRGTRPVRTRTERSRMRPDRTGRPRGSRGRGRRATRRRRGSRRSRRARSAAAGDAPPRSDRLRRSATGSGAAARGAVSNLGNDIANDRAAAAPRQATTKIVQAGTSPMIRPTVRGTAKEHSARGISMAALAPASEAVPAALGRIDSAVSPNRTVPKPARGDGHAEPERRAEEDARSRPGEAGERDQRGHHCQRPQLRLIDEDAEGDRSDQMGRGLAGDEDADELRRRVERQSCHERHRDEGDLVGQVRAVGCTPARRRRVDMVRLRHGWPSTMNRRLAARPGTCGIGSGPLAEHTRLDVPRGIAVAAQCHPSYAWRL